MRIDGYAFVTDPEKPTEERDCLNCAHCSRVMFIKKREDTNKLGGFCRMCMKHLCGPCADTGTCIPFQKRLEAEERRDALLRAIIG